MPMMCQIIYALLRLAGLIVFIIFDFADFEDPNVYHGHRKLLVH